MKIQPIDQVLWYLKRTAPQQLRHELKVDVVVVGGGMAGLTAAQAFKMKGLSVALLEKYFCGSGASGKSSGFITPDSEFSLHAFTQRYGKEKAKEIWEFAIGGVKHIQKNIEVFSLACDHQVEDTLVVANSSKMFKEDLEVEYTTRKELKYPSTLYTKEELPSVLGSEKYYGGIRYKGSFGINAYAYCQGMKEVLQEQGVFVYEETPVTRIASGIAETPYATVHADYIVVCADRFAPELNVLKKDIYHAQTFLLLSAPLEDKYTHTLFPQDNYMVWDTDLVYNYYRLTGDGRLMLGGGSVLTMYHEDEQHHNWRVVRKLEKYFKNKFPHIPVTFEYMWPGLIGITKDIIPIAGWDPQYERVYTIAGAAGLPWAAALGLYSADHIVDKRIEFDSYFSPTRKFPLGHFAQFFLGTKLTFALSNYKTLSSYE